MDFGGKINVIFMFLCMCCIPGSLSVNNNFYCQPTDVSSTQFKCLKWFGYTIARLGCTVYRDGQSIECFLRYGCKEGTIMGELRLCQETPRFSLYVDVYEMDVYEQRSNAVKATMGMGKMGELGVTLTSNGAYGSGVLTVTLGSETLYEGTVIDKTCKKS